MFLRLLKNAFLRLLPHRYYGPLIRALQANSYRRLDYPGAEIWLQDGIGTAGGKAGEPDLVEWLETSLQPGEVLYDIGANVGLYALIAAKYHRGQVRVYAFEPAFHTVPLLVNNIVRNQCQDVILPLCLPLAKDMTLAKFNYHGSMLPGNALHTFGEAIDYRGERFTPAFRQWMLSASLDEMVSRFQLDPPNHIKIDVDGIDFEILSGAEHVLKADGLKSVFMEISSRFDERQVTALMQRCGLSIVSTVQNDHTANRIYAKPSARLSRGTA